MKKYLNILLISIICTGAFISMPVMVSNLGENPVSYAKVYDNLGNFTQTTVYKVSNFGQELVGVPAIEAQVVGSGVGSGPDIGDMISDEPVPLGDVAQAVVELVNNWQGLGAVGIAGSLIMILIMLFRTTIISGLFKSDSARFGKRVAVILLGGTAGMLGFVGMGIGWAAAAAAGYISSGVAIAIFELVKAFISKKKK